MGLERHLLLRRNRIVHELLAESLDLLLESRPLPGQHLVGGLFRRQGIRPIGFPMVGVAALELVAVDKGARRDLSAADYADYAECRGPRVGPRTTNLEFERDLDQT